MKVKLFCLLLVTVCICSCSDIIEKSISNKNVSLIAPGNNDSVSSYTQTFYWGSVDNALTYELQLASPNFTKAITFIDTTISVTKFTQTLTPGAWQWQVRALNGSSQTAYTTNNLYIIKTSLAAQQVGLISPSNSGYFNNPSILQLKWEAITGAFKYKIQISSSGKSVLDTSVSNTQYSLASQNLGNGVYSWNVTGTNTTGDTSSITSDSWTFTIDEAYSYSPDTVTRSYPANKATITGTSVTFSWSYSPTTPTTTYAAPPDHYLLNVSKSGGSPSTINIPVKGTTATSTFSVTASSSYSWNVQIVDKAGNTTAATSNFSFTVQ